MPPPSFCPHHALPRSVVLILPPPSCRPNPVALILPHSSRRPNYAASVLQTTGCLPILPPSSCRSHLWTHPAALSMVSSSCPNPDALILQTPSHGATLILQPVSCTVVLILQPSSCRPILCPSCCLPNLPPSVWLFLPPSDPKGTSIPPPSPTNAPPSCPAHALVPMTPFSLRYPLQTKRGTAHIL